MKKVLPRVKLTNNKDTLLNFALMLVKANIPTDMIDKDAMRAYYKKGSKLK